jgi:hypothetical protein
MFFTAFGEMYFPSSCCLQFLKIASTLERMGMPWELHLYGNCPQHPLDMRLGEP